MGEHACCTRNVDERRDFASGSLDLFGATIMKMLFTAVGIAGLLTGCASGNQPDTRASSPMTAAQNAAPTLLTRNGSIPTLNGPIRIDRLATLDEPWGMVLLPDDRLLITEKPGRLRIFSEGKLSAPVQGVPAVVYFGQGGLLDVAVDPNFASNQLVYLSYAEAAAPQPAGAIETQERRLGAFQRMEDQTVKGGAVARGRLVAGALRDVTVIWRQTPKTVGRGHFGGRLAFAPDGTLFITSSDRMRFDPAQDRGTNLGKTVRINADGSIPADNPFAGVAGTSSDIWSMGHRNPSGMAFQPGSGRLWQVEFGPKGGDELNIVARGVNYGWPIVNEGVNYDDSPIPHHATRPEFERFVRAWTPVISPSSLLFYTGAKFPAWRGNALIGGLSSQAIIRLTLDGNRVTGEEVIPMGRRIRNLIEARDGSLLLLSESPNAELLRLSPVQ